MDASGKHLGTMVTGVAHKPRQHMFYTSGHLT